jgi:hypothetical protein
MGMKGKLMVEMKWCLGWSIGLVVVVVVESCSLGWVWIW